MGDYTKSRGYILRHGIGDYLQSLTKFQVVTAGIPTTPEEIDAVSKRDANTGYFAPYVVKHFYSIYQSGTRSYGGVRQDGYQLKFDLLVVAPDGDTSEDLRDYFMDSLLGWEQDGASPIETVPGYGTFTVDTATGNTVAFISTASYRCYVSDMDVVS